MRSSRIYICHTYYHVLISLIKEISQKYIKADIVICDSIPRHKKLVDSLIKSRIFNNVFTFSESKYNNNPKNSIKGINKLFINKKYKQMIKPMFEMKNGTYQEVNIFNDWTYMGIYLRANRIYYNLLEDSKDSYKVLDNYIQINYHKSILNKIFGFIYETVYFHGKSKYTKIVEVNDPNNIKIPKEKIRVKKKSELFEQLTEKEKIEIYNIFINNQFEISPTSRDNVLILTQPLVKDGMVENKEIQQKVYQEIINHYCEHLDVFVKPHPRDDFEYLNYFSNIKVIDQYIPTEVLNFHPQVKFNKAITVCSSSINGIEFANEKIYLGFDWLKEFK